MYPSQAFKSFLLSLSDYEVHLLSQAQTAAQEHGSSKITSDDAVIAKVLAGRGIKGSTATSTKANQLRQNLRYLLMGSSAQSIKILKEHVDYKSYLKSAAQHLVSKHRSATPCDNQSIKGKQTTMRADGLKASRSVVNLSGAHWQHNQQSISARQSARRSKRSHVMSRPAAGGVSPVKHNFTGLCNTAQEPEFLLQNRNQKPRSSLYQVQETKTGGLMVVSMTPSQGEDDSSKVIPRKAKKPSYHFNNNNHHSLASPNQQCSPCCSDEKANSRNSRTTGSDRQPTCSDEEVTATPKYQQPCMSQGYAVESDVRAADMIGSHLIPHSTTLSGMAGAPSYSPQVTFNQLPYQVDQRRTQFQDQLFNRIISPPQESSHQSGDSRSPNIRSVSPVKNRKNRDRSNERHVITSPPDDHVSRSPERVSQQASPLQLSFRPQPQHTSNRYSNPDSGSYLYQRRNLLTCDDASPTPIGNVPSYVYQPITEIIEACQDEEASSKDRAEYLLRQGKLTYSPTRRAAAKQTEPHTSVVTKMPYQQPYTQQQMPLHRFGDAPYLAQSTSPHALASRPSETSVSRSYCCSAIDEKSPGIRFQIAPDSQPSPAYHDRHHQLYQADNNLFAAIDDARTPQRHQTSQKHYQQHDSSTKRFKPSPAELSAYHNLQQQQQHMAQQMVGSTPVEAQDHHYKHGGKNNISQVSPCTHTHRTPTEQVPMQHRQPLSTFTTFVDQPAPYHQQQVPSDNAEAYAQSLLQSKYHHQPQKSSQSLISPSAPVPLHRKAYSSHSNNNYTSQSPLKQLAAQRQQHQQHRHTQQTFKTQQKNKSPTKAQHRSPVKAYTTVESSPVKKQARFSFGEQTSSTPAGNGGDQSNSGFVSSTPQNKVSQKSLSKVVMDQVEQYAKEVLSRSSTKNMKGGPDNSPPTQNLSHRRSAKERKRSREQSQQSQGSQRRSAKERKQSRQERGKSLPQIDEPFHLPSSHKSRSASKHKARISIEERRSKIITQPIPASFKTSPSNRASSRSPPKVPQNFLSPPAAPQISYHHQQVSSSSSSSSKEDEQQQHSTHRPTVQASPLKKQTPKSTSLQDSCLMIASSQKLGSHTSDLTNKPPQHKSQNSSLKISVEKAKSELDVDQPQQFRPAATTYNEQPSLTQSEAFVSEQSECLRPAASQTFKGQHNQQLNSGVPPRQTKSTPVDTTLPASQSVESQRGSYIREQQSQPSSSEDDEGDSQERIVVHKVSVTLPPKDDPSNSLPVFQVIESPRILNSTKSPLKRKSRVAASKTVNDSSVKSRHLQGFLSGRNSRQNSDAEASSQRSGYQSDTSGAYIRDQAAAASKVGAHTAQSMQAQSIREPAKAAGSTDKQHAGCDEKLAKGIGSTDRQHAGSEQKMTKGIGSTGRQHADSEQNLANAEGSTNRQHADSDRELAKATGSIEKQPAVCDKKFDQAVGSTDRQPAVCDEKFDQATGSNDNHHTKVDQQRAKTASITDKDHGSSDLQTQGPTNPKTPNQHLVFSSEPMKVKVSSQGQHLSTQKTQPSTLPSTQNQNLETATVSDFNVKIDLKFRGGELTQAIQTITPGIPLSAVRVGPGECESQLKLKILSDSEAPIDPALIRQIHANMFPSGTTTSLQ